MDTVTGHLTPAQYVIRAFGGVRKLARELKKSPSTVSRWPKPKERGGSGGRIPSDEQLAILELATRRGLDVTASDLIYGRKIPTQPFQAS